MMVKEHQRMVIERPHHSAQFALRVALRSSQGDYPSVSVIPALSGIIYCLAPMMGDFSLYIRNLKSPLLSLSLAL